MSVSWSAVHGVLPTDHSRASDLAGEKRRGRSDAGGWSGTEGARAHTSVEGQDSRPRASSLEARVDVVCPAG